MENLMPKDEGMYFDDATKSFISNSAVIDKFAKIGLFTIIGDYCFVSSYVRIKQRVTLGRYTSIDKGSFIGPHTVFLSNPNPWGDLKGGAQVGKKVWIGANCTINGGIKICDNVIIGANSFVKDDITCPGNYYGTPVKFKSHIAGI